MSIVLDLAVVAIVLLYVFICANQGFVKVVVGAVGTIAAFVLAFTFSTPLATLTYDKMIEPAIVSMIEENTQNTATATADQIIVALPKAITENAKNFGISIEEVTKEFTASAQTDVTDIITKVADEVVEPVAVKILSLAFTVLLFAVLSVLVKILASLLNKLFSFSIVGKLNRNLGGAIGLLKGIVIASVLCIALSFVISLTGSGFWIFTPENIAGTYIFKTLAGLSEYIII